MKMFSKMAAMLQVLLLALLGAAPVHAQHLNPQLGWSWKKSEFAALGEGQTKLYLHYRLQSEKSAPAVLVGHDNGGISENEKIFADFMYAQGFHVFVVDRITGRNRVASPLEIFLIEDTFAAARYIRQTFSDKIDAARLSYASFSGDGGFGGLMALQPKARKLLMADTPDLAKFHRVVAIYPHCVHVKGGEVDTPALIIGAELDGSDPKVCQQVYEKIPQVKVEIYPGAYHGFDQASVRKKTWVAKPVIMPGTCEWQMDLDVRRQANGRQHFMLSTMDGVTQASREFTRHSETCSTRAAGYFSEYRDDLTQRAFRSTVEFLKN